MRPSMLSGSVAARTLRASSCDRTVGTPIGRFARTAPNSSSPFLTTPRNRQMRSVRAWFCVDAEMWRPVAKCG